MISDFVKFIGKEWTEMDLYLNIETLHRVR